MSDRIPKELLPAHLRRLEEILLDPTVRRDSSYVDELLASDFQEFGSSGRSWSRDQILELLRTETYSPPEVKDFQCTSLAENVALVTYHTVRQDLLTAVRTTTMRSSIWILEAERWRVRFHQGTRVP
jgi:ribonuclease HI